MVRQGSGVVRKIPFLRFRFLKFQGFFLLLNFRGSLGGVHVPLLEVGFYMVTLSGWTLPMDFLWIHPRRFAGDFGRSLWQWIFEGDEIRIETPFHDFAPRAPGRIYTKLHKNNPHKERHSFTNCLWNIRGIFHNYAGNLRTFISG